jgi:hypothetical protein
MRKRVGLMHSSIAVCSSMAMISVKLTKRTRQTLGKVKQDERYHRDGVRAVRPADVSATPWRPALEPITVKVRKLPS